MLFEKGSPHRRPKFRPTPSPPPPPNVNPDAPPISSASTASASPAHRAAQEVIRKPLSESLRKLRRAQRALTRRKRRSRVRVSFRHSTGSRTSSTAKRVSRQLKAGDVKQGGGSPRSRPLPPPPSSEENVGGCSWSPSKPPRPPPKDNIRANIKQAGGTRHRHAPPKKPAQPSSHPNTRNQTSGCPQTEHIKAVFDCTKGKTLVATSVDHNLTRRRVQTSRYSVFPKAHPRHCKRSVDPVKESIMIRKSPIIQQQRLSALVPSPPAQTTTTTTTTTTTPVPPHQKQLPDVAKISGINPKQREEAATTTTRTDPKTDSERTLDEFVRELEEFAKAFDGTRGSLLLSTLSTTASVRTVRELLPWREEFWEAGLAVTSCEQKGQVRRYDEGEKKLGGSRTRRLDQFGGSNVPKVGAKGKGGLRMGVVKGVSSLDITLGAKELSFGTGVMEGVASLGSKESSSGTVVVYKPRRGMMADETEMKEGGSSSRNNEIYSGSSSTSVEPVKLAAVEKRVVRARASTVFLANKPLPVAPASSVTASSEDVGTTVGSQSEVKSEGYQKLGSSSGSEKEPLLPLSEQRVNSSSVARSVKGKEVDRGGGEDEKVLPALLPPRTAPQVRHGIKNDWHAGGSMVSAWRQLPTTIVEEREPSPEKEGRVLGEKGSIDQEQKLLMENKGVNQAHGLNKPAGVLKTKTELEAKGKGINTPMPTPAQRKTPVKAPFVINRGVITKTPELLLPQTWEHHPLGTPSSFKRALDDVVRKLDAMEVRECSSPFCAVSSPTTMTITTSSSTKKRTSSSSGSNGKPPSPTTPAQRLQKAAMMRRERMDAEQQQQQQQQQCANLPPSVSIVQPVRSQEYIPYMMPPPGGLGFRPSESNSSRGLGQGRNLRKGLFAGAGAREMEDDRDISDEDVLKGLKIICAASADKEFDGLVRRETGLRLRRFLADLRTFEFLGGNGQVPGVGGGGRQQMGVMEKRRRDVQVERENRRRSIRGMDGLRGLGDGKNMKESKREGMGVGESVRDRDTRRSFRGLGNGLMR
ncbi:Putative protein of unknown function [Podospora comata]|uniref:Uncharacterized protein n=1 Tax=Podospora comata TaxID=48703 RepID=A0ABY6RWF3_PODCO|nr:Putative protein of unknown function [Podospora comata]